MSLEHHRLNIGPAARQIRSGERNIMVGSKLPEGKFEELYSLVKPEMYALTSLIADSAVKRAHSLRATRPPYGVVRPDEKWWADSNAPVMPHNFDPNQLYTISGPMRRTLLNGLFVEISEIKAGVAEKQLEKSYQRLNELITALRNSDPASTQVQIRFNEGVHGYIASGINFGSLVMASFIDQIDKKSQSKDPAFNAQIARNTYPLVVKLSSGDLDKVSTAMSSLKSLENVQPIHARFNPKYFQLKENRLGPYLDISDSGTVVLRKLGIDLDNLNAEDGQTIGCPAGINFGDGSAIKLLWDWHVDILEENQKQQQQKAISKSMEGTGRNEPCPCGSGIKFKKCHLGK